MYSFPINIVNNGKCNLSLSIQGENIETQYQYAFKNQNNFTLNIQTEFPFYLYTEINNSVEVI